MSQNRSEHTGSRFTSPAARRTILTLGIGLAVGYAVYQLTGLSNEKKIEDKNNEIKNFEQQLSNLTVIIQDIGANISSWNSTLFNTFSTTINTMNKTGQEFTQLVSDLIYTNKTCMETWDGLYKSNGGCKNINSTIDYYFSPYPICADMLKFFCNNLHNRTAVEIFFTSKTTFGPTNLTCYEVYDQIPFVFCDNDFFNNFYFFGYDRQSTVPYFTQECLSVFDVACHDLMQLRKDQSEVIKKFDGLKKLYNAMNPADTLPQSNMIAGSILCALVSTGLAYLSCVGLNCLVDPNYRRQIRMMFSDSSISEEKKPLLEEGRTPEMKLK